MKLSAIPLNIQSCFLVQASGLKTGLRYRVCAGILRLALVEVANAWVPWVSPMLNQLRRCPMSLEQVLEHVAQVDLDGAGAIMQREREREPRDNRTGRKKMWHVPRRQSLALRDISFTFSPARRRQACRRLLVRHLCQRAGLCAGLSLRAFAVGHTVHQVVSPPAVRASAEAVWQWKSVPSCPLGCEFH